MGTTWIDLLVSWSDRRQTGAKLLSLAGGITLFLLAFPCLLAILALQVIEPLISMRWPAAVGIVIATVGIPAGLALLLWSAMLQWRKGEGTPVPIAPTQKLVFTGPYRWCRNPIQLGASLYFFGVLSVAASPVSGLILTSIVFSLGSVYHRFVEEKELERRFGEAYLEYRRRTPFIIPRPPRTPSA